MSHLDDVVGFLLCLLDFLPGLLLFLLQERDSVSKQFDVFLSALAGDSLVSERSRDLTLVRVVVLLLIVLLVILLVLVGHFLVFFLVLYT